MAVPQVHQPIVMGCVRVPIAQTDHDLQNLATGLNVSFYGATPVNRRVLASTLTPALQEAVSVRSSGGCLRRTHHRNTGEDGQYEMRVIPLEQCKYRNCRMLAQSVEAPAPYRRLSVFLNLLGPGAPVLAMVAAMIAQVLRARFISSPNVAARIEEGDFSTN